MIDTGHVYKTYNYLIKDLIKKYTPEFLNKNGVCVSSIVTSADELIVSSLGDIHIYLF